MVDDSQYGPVLPRIYRKSKYGHCNNFTKPLKLEVSIIIVVCMLSIQTRMNVVAPVHIGPSLNCDISTNVGVLCMVILLSRQTSSIGYHLKA